MLRLFLFSSWFLTIVQLFEARNSFCIVETENVTGVLFELGGLQTGFESRGHDCAHISDRLFLSLVCCPLGRLGACKCQTFQFAQKFCTPNRWTCSVWLAPAFSLFGGATYFVLGFASTSAMISACLEAALPELNLPSLAQWVPPLLPTGDSLEQAANNSPPMVSFYWHLWICALSSFGQRTKTKFWGW